MNIKDVATELGINERTVRYWITRGTHLGPFFERRDSGFFVYKRDFNKFARFYK